MDEERLYEFYDDKIPPYIASAKAFEDWLGKVGDDEFLKFKDEDVVNSVVNVGQEFPKFWQVGAVKFPLSYVFDPSSDDDGVSVKVGQGHCLSLMVWIYCGVWQGGGLSLCQGY